MCADVAMLSEFAYSKAVNSYIAAAIKGNHMINHVLILIYMIKHSKQ